MIPLKGHNGEGDDIVLGARRICQDDGLCV